MTGSDPKIASILFFIFCPVFATFSFAMTPEQETAYLAKRLKPISDEGWAQIAGSKVEETYTVVQGDTLYDISNRLFGDPNYWPKIWAMNNNTILNPHWISPDMTIHFSPGSGVSLPAMSLGDTGNSNQNYTASAASASIRVAPKHYEYQYSDRPQEWRKLPRQSWEPFLEKKIEGVDSKTGFHEAGLHRDPLKDIGWAPQVIPASAEIPVLGQIIGSRSEGSYLSISDLVYVSAEEQLQIGETYGITAQPTLLKSAKSDRLGYSYRILGQVKILAVRDHVYVGRILTTRFEVTRGSYLIPLPPRIPTLKPVAGPRPLPGIIMFDHHLSTFTTAQDKEVFIDRGSDDGITPGMVFRAYQHYDPGTEKNFSNSNFIIDADLIVTQVSETFSSARVIRSLSPITEHTGAILLTDISDLNSNQEYTLKDLSTLDDLDLLDDGQGLGSGERDALKQLDRWKRNPGAEAPPTMNLESTKPSPSSGASADPSTLSDPLDSTDLDQLPDVETSSTQDPTMNNQMTSFDDSALPPSDEELFPSDQSDATEGMNSKDLTLDESLSQTDTAAEPPLSMQPVAPSSGTLDMSSAPPESSVTTPQLEGFDDMGSPPSMEEMSDLNFDE